MKGLRVIFAAVAALVFMPAPAMAYSQAPVAPAAITLVPHAEVIQRRDGRRYERGRRWDRRDRNWRGRYRWRTTCNTQWRGGRRERVCRRVRYR